MKTEENCKKCHAELIIFKVWGKPNWFWCQNCDSVYDENFVYKGSRSDLEYKESYENR